LELELELVVEVDLAVVDVILVVGTVVEVLVEAAVVLVLEGKLELELVLAVLDVVGAEVVVVAETLAREAEYAEQRARPTDSACPTSAGLQAVRKQPTANPPMAASLAHWQPWSARAHPAETTAAERHGRAQDGSPEKSCADTRPPTAATTTARIAPFILTRFLSIYVCLRIG